MIFPRVSGHVGQPIRLNVTFYQGGIPTDPFAIRKVDIYQSSVRPDNLIAEIPFVLPDDPTYPSPAAQIVLGSGFAPGEFELIWDVPSDLVIPNNFFDVWNFIPEDPGSSADLDDEDLFLTKCNRFWVFPDAWFADDGLETIKIGFEPLDLKFHQPEIRTLEIGLVPLPLYDFNFNLISPIIPHLTGTISIQTENCEILVDEEPVSIGLRQGSYRSTPFVLQFKLDTTRFLKGTYRYRVTVKLPNGETRVSAFFRISIG